MKERTVITPVLIRQVQLMLAGGATGKEAAEITGTSEGTISRIKKAGFDYDTFQKNTEARRKQAEVPEDPETALWKKLRFPMKVEKVEETEGGLKITARQPEKTELRDGVDYQEKANEELPGQIGMDLQPEKPTEMSDQVKMMRMIAGQTDKIVNQEKMSEQVQKRIWTKLDEMLQMEARILDVLIQNHDSMGQILRVIGPEGGKRG